MKRVVISLAILFPFLSFAQQQTFDITTYTPPKGWKANQQQNVMVYSIVDNVKKTWAQIGIYSSTASKGSIENDFANEWNELAVKQYKATGLETDDALTANDWKVKAGGGKFRYNNADAIVMLTTMAGYNVCVSILATTNSQDYLTTIQSFLETVDLKKPSGHIVNNQPVNQNEPVAPGKFTFTTTNFNDGWISNVYNDYVLTTKGNIKVYLSFVEKFNASDFTGNGKEARHHYWNNYVSKYFVTGEMRYNRGGALSDYSDDYIEGWATDRQTNQSRYIAMILRIVPYTGTLSIIIASAPDDKQLRQQFPKADLKFDNDLLPMYNYNKFAVGKNDLVGKWVSGGDGAMLNWYSTTTGNSVGSTAAVTSDVFVFGAGSTYSSTHKGATGWVGSMNTYHQEFKGVYKVTDWSVTATNRWDGKTEIFDTWFEIVKGGRVLHLVKGPTDTKLFKEK